MRIGRYRELLGTKYKKRWKQLDAFVDVNFPRADRITEQTFRSYSRLLQAVDDRQVRLVYIDIEMQVGTSQYYHWVAHSLERSGVRVVNAFYDEDEVLQQSLAQSYGKQADAREIDDASDFVGFFPALSSRISHAALRRVLHSRGYEKGLWTLCGIGSVISGIVTHTLRAAPHSFRKSWNLSGWAYAWLP
jgi:hypothetical protein